MGWAVRGILASGILPGCHGPQGFMFLPLYQTDRDIISAHIILLIPSRRDRRVEF